MMLIVAGGQGHIGAVSVPGALLRTTRPLHGGTDGNADPSMSWIYLTPWLCSVHSSGALPADQQPRNRCDRGDDGMGRRILIYMTNTLDV